MSLLGSLFGTATNEHDSISIYPEVLDSTDETAVSEGIERYYRCDEVFIDEEYQGLWLIIRSNMKSSVDSKLLRHLQYAGFDIVTVTSRKRDGQYRLEIGASRYPPEGDR